MAKVMYRLFTYLLFLFVAVSSFSQVVVSGIVVSAENDEPLPGASAIVKGSDGKIRKFSTSKADGSFTMAVTDLAGCRLEVTMMSFAKAIFSLDSISLPITVRLSPGNTLLKEVTVKAQRIREQGDTISYNVSSFAQSQDRSIGDVLKRMPGINVEKSGKIQYQGEDINKFYIEGSDLLGGKYGLATNGIDHEDVGAVEVMENHQPLQVLSGVSFSDKAAINLKLKSKAKATWSVHGKCASGYSTQPSGTLWNVDVFAMAVMSGFQNITTFRTNNTGTDLSAQLTDFFAKARSTTLSRYINVGLPDVPGLNRRHTLFNRSVLVATNGLWKTRRGEVKAQIDYAYNRLAANANNTTTYFLENGDRVITENRIGIERSHSLSGTFIYEQNEKTSFINNSLKTILDWDNIRLDISGSMANRQTASIPDFYLANDFKLIKRFGEHHLVTFKSVNEWESMPQTLDVLTSHTAGTQSLREKIREHAFFTHESASYALVFKGVSISLEGGIKAFVRSMNSAIDGLPDISNEALNLTNTVGINSFTIYLNPKFEYWYKKINLTLDAPISFAAYTFDKAIANNRSAYFSPALSFNWKPDSRFNMTLKAASGRSPMNISMVYPGYVMTDYRTFHSGVDEFYNTRSQSVSAKVAYKHTRRGLFANAMVLQSWVHSPYTLARQLFGDYIAYSYSPAKNDSRNLTAVVNAGKTLDFIRGSVAVNASISRHDTHLLSENDAVMSVGRSWMAGAKLSSTPASWLSFDYRFMFSSSKLALNGYPNPALDNIENELTVNIIPAKKWEWTVSADHYRNELTPSNFKNIVLLDTKLTYKLSKRIELGAYLTNIFNRRSYNYRIYNDLNSFESRRNLRGRELLISISLKK